MTDFVFLLLLSGHWNSENKKKKKITILNDIFEAFGPTFHSHTEKTK